MGVEPMSAIPSLFGTPCIFFAYTACITAKAQYNTHGLLVLLVPGYKSAESTRRVLFGFIRVQHAYRHVHCTSLHMALSHYAKAMFVSPFIVFYLIVLRALRQRSACALHRHYHVEASTPPILYLFFKDHIITTIITL
jgi:hypothetical protein